MRAEVSGEAAVCKRFMLELWDQYHPYADANFLTAIRAEFHARFWEMYLTCALLDQADKRNYKLECHKPGPDVLLVKEGRKIWIEAVIATDGQEGKPDSLVAPIKRAGEVVAGKVPGDQIVLRYTSGLRAKQEKFEEYRTKGIVDKADSCVIALNGRALAHPWDLEIPRILKALYPLGALGVAFDTRTMEIVGSKHEFRPKITKKAGGIVATTMFVDEENAGISAVLFSNAYAWMTQRPLGPDFLLAYNPHAANPVPRGLIPAARESTGIPKDDGSYEVTCEEC